MPLRAMAATTNRRRCPAVSSYIQIPRCEELTSGDLYKGLVSSVIS